MFVPYLTLWHSKNELLISSHFKLFLFSNFQSMNWQNLYQLQLHENKELKKQLEVVESILRNFLPIIENDNEEKNN